MRTFNRTLFALACLAGTLFVAGLFYPSLLERIWPANPAVLDAPVRLATGPESGMYQNFGLALAEGRTRQITLVQSQGSVDNIKHLQQGSVDFILVQNDIAQNFYFGEKGQQRFQNIRYVWPLFAEYVQVIVPENSNVRVLADLRGKQICVGGKDSGTYRNAIDVLSEAGLRESIDFFPINQSSKDCIAEIRNGNSIAALFTTSHQVVAENEIGFRQLFLSDAIADELIRKSPHFRKIARVTKTGEATTQIAVETFLATRAETENYKVEALIRILIADWPKYRLRFPEIRKVDEPVFQNGKAGIEFHSAVRNVAAAEKVIGSIDWSRIVFSLALVIAGICAISMVYQNSYDRIGQKLTSNKIVDLITSVLGFIAKPLFFVLGTVVVIFGCMKGIIYLEEYYAQSIGARSPFSGMTDKDSVVWLTAYVGSGFTSDIYPVSFWGRLILAVLGIIMAIGPFSFVIALLDKMKKRREDHRRGLGRVQIADHILLCGWNEKAEGIIYGLTGHDIDERQQVTIIANMAEDTPLDTFNFDQNYVSYVRGDASDIKVLHRANVSKAKAALVLADFGGDLSEESATWNRKSILATFNVEAARPNAHICAEMEYLRGLHYYRASGANAIVHPNTVVTRMTAMAIVHPLLLDYVLDMISYHDFDELYSEQVGTLVRKTGSRPTLRDIRNSRSKYPVNILGAIRRGIGSEGNSGVESASSNQIYDATFGQDSNLLVWDDQAELNPADFVLYTAKRDHSLYVASPLINGLKGFWSFTKRLDLHGLGIMVIRRFPKHLGLWLKSMGLPTLGSLTKSAPLPSGETYRSASALQASRVLICFDAQRTSSGAQISTSEEHRTALARFIADLPVQLAALGWKDYRIETCFEDELDSRHSELREFDRIFVMTTPQIRSRSSSIEQVNDVDTGLILLTKRVHQLLIEAGLGAIEASNRIASELLNFNNRELMANAKTGDIIPSALLVGRFIAKQAVHQDHASDFLMALMNLADGTHLYLHEVVSDDPVFSGWTYSQLLNAEGEELPSLKEGIDRYRLLAWLPAASAEMRRLSNSIEPPPGSVDAEEASDAETVVADKTRAQLSADYAHHFVTVVDYRFPDRLVAPGDKLILMVRHTTIH